MASFWSSVQVSVSQSRQDLQHFELFCCSAADCLSKVMPRVLPDRILTWLAASTWPVYNQIEEEKQNGCPLQ